MIRPPGERTWGAVAVAGLALAVALLLPAFLGAYHVRILTGIFMFGVLASAWNLIGGYAGYPDFGGAAFIGIGAYTTGVLMTRTQAPFAAALLAGCLLATAAAIVMGALLLRLRGHYFAIATLGFMLVLRQVAANLDVTGAGSGMNLPVAADFKVFYYWMLAALTFGVLAGFVLPRTPVGYAIAAIRENQDASRVLGIEPLPYKILAYAANAFLFGAAGGIYAYWFTFIDPPTVFNLDFTIQAVVMALFGGPSTALGPVVGAVVLKSLDITLTNRWLFLHNAFFGVLVVVLVLFAPRGLAEVAQAPAGLWRAFRSAFEENRV